MSFKISDNQVIIGSGNTIQYGVADGQAENGKNHPEWYMLPESQMGVYPTGLNYAMDRAAVLGDEVLTASMPLYYVISDKLSTYCKGDDSSMFQSACTTIFTALSTNSGRLPSGYTRETIAEYLHAVTTMAAMLASSTRSWMATFTSDVTDSTMPSGFLDAMGSSQWTETDDIRDALKRLWIRLSAFPCPCDLLNKRIWMYSNVFMDYKGEKPTYIFHWPVDLRIYNNGAEVFRGSTGTDIFSSGTNFAVGQPDVTWASQVDALDDLMDHIEKVYSVNQMRADLLRVYGNDNMLKAVKPMMDILDTPIPVIVVTYDEYMQRKLSNIFYAVPMYGYQLGSPSTYTTGNPWDGFEVEAWDNTPTITATPSDNLLKLYGDLANPIYIDGAGVPIDKKEEQLSISDLAIVVNQSTQNNSHSAKSPSYIVKSAGTEIPICACVYYRIRQANGTLGFRSVKLGSIMYISTGATNLQLDYLMKTVAMATALDSRPRLRVFNNGPSGGDDPYFCWDSWDFGKVAEVSRNSMRARHAVITYALTLPKTELKLKKASDNTDDHGGRRNDRKPKGKRCK